MKNFITKISLTPIQASKCVDKIYTEHLDNRENELSHNDYTLEQNKAKLKELMSLPVGSIVKMSSIFDNNSRFVFEYVHEFSNKKLVVYRKETRTAQHLAMTFLCSEKFGWFKYMLGVKFGVMWHKFNNAEVNVSEDAISY